VNGTFFAAELAAAEAGCLDEWLRFNDLADVRTGLPAWAEQVAGLCPRYEFTTQWVGDGRSVVAYRLEDGPGPWLVVTPVEAEMRQALGLATAGEEGSP
jgi:hypothetical protein